MWAFFRRQTYYFLWGFTIALVACVAYAVGLSDLVKYIIISGLVGIIVSLIIFFLERRFPEKRTGDFVD
ncbi:MAG: hypothetical protein ABI305_08985 [Tepidiformaceae bacterium]